MLAAKPARDAGPGLSRTVAMSCAGDAVTIARSSSAATMTPTTACCRRRERGDGGSPGLRREAPDASAAGNAVGTFGECPTFEYRIPIRTQGCPDSGCLGMATTVAQRWKAEDFYMNRERPTSALGAGPRANIDFAHCVRAAKPDTPVAPSHR